MGQEYSYNDWLQIVLLLCGMPVVAVLGASIGLVGRIRKGGFLAATIAGLAGAAIASATLYLGIWTLRLEPSIDPRIFLEIYESGYQRYITVACLIATFVITILFAVAWRVRVVPSPSTRPSISLRTAILMQVLSLLCVGSWCGLRHQVVNTADPHLMAKRFWEERNFQLYTGDSLTFSGSGFTDGEVRQIFSPDNLAEISKSKIVRGLNIAHCDLDEIDLSPLQSAEQLQLLRFTDSTIDKCVQSEVVKLTRLTGVALADLQATQPTLESLTKLPKLETLTLSNTRLEREDLRRFFAGARLRSLQFQGLQALHGGKAIDYWPPMLKFIYMTGGNLTSEDLAGISKIRSLTHLHLNNTAFDDAALAHFDGSQQLQNVSFTNRGITEKGFEIVATKMRPPLLSIFSGSLTPQSAEHLSSIPNLQVLSLSCVICGDEAISKFGRAQSLRDLKVTSPDVTETGLFSLAQCPGLVQLQYPLFPGCEEFELRFAAERTRLGLSRVQLTPGPALDEKGAIVVRGAK